MSERKHHENVETLKGILGSVVGALVAMTIVHAAEVYFGAATLPSLTGTAILVSIDVLIGLQLESSLLGYSKAKPVLVVGRYSASAAALLPWCSGTWSRSSIRTGTRSFRLRLCTPLFF